MSLLPKSTQWRDRWPLVAIVVTLIAISAGGLHPGDCRPPVIREADALPYRTTEGRLASAFAYRPYREVGKSARTELLSLEATATVLRKRWDAVRDRTAARTSAEAQMLAGKSEAAAALLADILERESGRTDPLGAIQSSRNAELLTDFSAAMLQQPHNVRALVLAFEAGDRARRLAPMPSAAWNRALAAERIGAREAAARGWCDAAALETSPDWKREASGRADAAARAIRPPMPSPELFFHGLLTAKAAAGEAIGDLLPADRMASSTGSMLAAMTARDRERFRAALETYADGRKAFARDDLRPACRAYSEAEEVLTSMRSPLALLIGEQRIRCQCVRAQPECLARIRALRAKLVALQQYPWLAARTAYAEGQALYRQGRIYEAAESFQTALREFLAVGDEASAGLTHSVLGNTYSVAGEADTALEHHLVAVRLRYAYAGDRRRIQLEDAMLFLLRHGYVATAELLLDELSTTTATDGGRVMEAVLRGVIALRQGNTSEGEQQFERAHRLVDRIGDTTLRAEAKRAVLLAEAGSDLRSARRRLADIDAAAAAAQQEEIALWLPRMLTERGIAYEAAHQPRRAEADFLRAILILEQREPRIDQSSLTLGTGATRESAFDRAIRLYLKEGRIAAALAAAQRSTSARISSLHARAAGVRDVFRVDPTKGNHSLEDLRSVLPPGHVAVAQHLLSDALITWVVTRTEVRAVRRDIRAEQVIDAVGDLHACGSRGRCADGAGVERVSNLLLRDWIDHVPRGATLWLQRPIELQAVPFALLKTRAGERMLFRNPVTNGSTSATLVRAERLDVRRERGITALFAAAPRPVGLDPLPMTTREVTRSARFYDTADIEVPARRSLFATAFPYTIVHFAGHVLVNDEQPLLSALAFQDGLLYVHEIDRDAFRDVRLVVLSGCDSGRAPKPMMSIANALLSQGAPSVVYTVWPIEDSVGADFALAFHRALASGKSRAESLQQAALSIWRRHPGDPAAWAAFQLAGAPSPITANRPKEGRHAKQ